MITTNNKNKIVLEKIYNVSMGREKTELININYIIKQILSDMQINTDYIQITKSKKTLEYYHNYWNKIL